jgi:hypothetical protein
MNINEIVTLMQVKQGMKLIGVQFSDGGKTYTYKCATIPDLRIGDVVVVPNKLNADPSIGRVLSLDQPHYVVEAGPLSHVIARVDFSAYEAVLASERQAAERLALAEIDERLRSYNARFGGIVDTLTVLPAPATEQVAADVPWDGGSV